MNLNEKYLSVLFFDHIYFLFLFSDEPPPFTTRCQLHREHVLSSEREGRPSVGAYVPQCDENGEYVPQQVSTLKDVFIPTDS